MRRKNFPGAKVYSNWIWATMFIVLLLFTASCSNQPSPGPGPSTSTDSTRRDTIVVVKWFDVAVKFSQDVSGTARQTALHSLESMLVDTIMQLRQQPTYANYNPQLYTSFEPARDSLYFHVIVSSPPRLLKDSLCDCQCTCPPKCKFPQCPCSPGCLTFLQASAGPSPIGLQILSDVADTVKVNDVVIYHK